MTSERQHNRVDQPYIHPELQIILHCAQLELTPQDIEVIRRLITTGINWPLLIANSQHHRLVPLVYTHLSKTCVDLIPEVTFQQLTQLHQQITRICLMQVAELKRITTACKQKDIDLAILKGWAIVKPLYKNIALRQAHDVDILVRQPDLAAAATILAELDYHVENMPVGFTVDSKMGQQVIRDKNELSYISKTRSTYVDLHWQLSHSHAEFPIKISRLWQDMLAQNTNQNNNNPTAYHLPDTLNFVFLCYHGAKHRWFRLHWLCDVALLMKQQELDWQAILKEANQLGVLSSVGLAVVLCNTLFRVPIPNAIASNTVLLKTGKNLANKIMVSIILSTPKENTTDVDHKDVLWKLYWGVCLQSQWRYRLFTWHYLLAPSVSDFRIIKLPDRLFWLYRILRPIRWFFTVFVLAKKSLLNRVRIRNSVS